MEQTLGKRISFHRKRLGLTQDQLAEQLGITAQAVSKWENDQSCPDITTLPLLARIFGITTDELLGLEPPPAVRAEEEPEGLHLQTDGGHIDFEWSSGRRGEWGLAAVAILTGGLLLAGNLLDWPVSFWGLLWPCALLVFGLGGLYPRVQVFRIGCALFGGYALARELGTLPERLGGDLLFPAMLLLLGLSLVVESITKSRPGPMAKSFSSSHNVVGNRIECGVVFSGDTKVIRMEELGGGEVECVFGGLTVDLTGVEAILPGAVLDVESVFGSVTLILPSHLRAETVQETVFSRVEFSGHPAPDARPVTLKCQAVFGSICVQYV